MLLARLPEWKRHAARQYMATCAGNTSQDKEGKLILLCSCCAIFYFICFPFGGEEGTQGLRSRVIRLTRIAIVPSILLLCCRMSTVTSSCFRILCCIRRNVVNYLCCIFSLLSRILLVSRGRQRPSESCNDKPPESYREPEGIRLIS